MEDAIDFVHKLAASERVEQVFVRHAFRFFLGRNENLGDGPSLRLAHAVFAVLALASRSRPDRAALTPHDVTLMGSAMNTGPAGGS